MLFLRENSILPDIICITGESLLSEDLLGISQASSTTPFYTRNIPIQFLQRCIDQRSNQLDHQGYGVLCDRNSSPSIRSIHIYTVITGTDLDVSGIFSDHMSSHPCIAKIVNAHHLSSITKFTPPSSLICMVLRLSQNSDKAVV